jgi:hypothetical protein
MSELFPIIRRKRRSLLPVTVKPSSEPATPPPTDEPEAKPEVKPDEKVAAKGKSR